MDSLLLALNLKKVPAQFVNFKARTERSGPDEVPAADLEFVLNQSADVLAFFAPTLKAHLFDEKSLDLADGMALRYPNMHYPITFDREMTGATVELDLGLKNPMVFHDCSVNKFRVTPMAGGSVVLSIRVQCKPEEDQAGKLYMLQGQKGIAFTLTPAPLPEMGDSEQPPATEKPKSNKRVPKNEAGATVQ